MQSNNNYKVNARQNLPKVKPKDLEAKPFKLVNTEYHKITHHDRVMTRKRKDSHHPLRDLRLRAGFTLEELAQATEMSPSYLSRLENGTRRLNADILQSLSVALNCNPADLLPHRNPHIVTYVDHYEANLKSHQEAVSNANKASTDTVANTVKSINSHQQTYSCDQIRGSEILTYSNLRASQVIVDPSKSLQENCNVLVFQNDHAFIGKILDIKARKYADQPLDMTIEFINNNNSKEQKTFSKNSFKAIYCVVGHIEAA